MLFDYLMGKANLHIFHILDKESILLTDIVNLFGVKSFKAWHINEDFNFFSFSRYSLICLS